MRAATLRQTRTRLVGATAGLALHQQAARQHSFATRSAMAFSTDRANTISFISLSAMGNHMVRNPSVEQESSICRVLTDFAQLNNLITRYRQPGSGNELGFALCDVNQATVDSVIKRHGTERPNVTLVSCSCKCIPCVAPERKMPVHLHMPSHGTRLTTLYSTT
jgi:hypothetical protein